MGNKIKFVAYELENLKWTLNTRRWCRYQIKSERSWWKKPEERVDWAQNYTLPCPTLPFYECWFHFEDLISTDKIKNCVPIKHKLIQYKKYCYPLAAILAHPPTIITIIIFPMQKGWILYYVSSNRMTSHRRSLNGVVPASLTWIDGSVRCQPDGTSTLNLWLSLIDINSGPPVLEWQNRRCHMT